MVEEMLAARGISLTYVGTSGFRSRSIVWERIADTIWASGHDGASKGRKLIAIDPRAIG